MQHLATHELHVHLYGCLDAPTLWRLGRESPPNPQRIQWYKDEFRKISGTESRIDEFWAGSDSPELLRSEYEIREACRFSRFQAAINLPIALFPLHPTEPSRLFAAAMSSHKDQGLTYVEYRVFLPPYFDRATQARYLSTMARQSLDAYLASDQTFDPRLVISLTRDTVLCESAYETLKNWQKAESSPLSRRVVGIDFCADDAGHPPSSKQLFLERCEADNHRDPEFALPVLYHVGETLDHLRPESALRWIFTAAELGVQRIGHASVLGMQACDLVYADNTESSASMDEHRGWMRLNHHRLADYGYRESDDILARLKSMQDAVANQLKELACTIESCPTSNYLLGGVRSKSSIPLFGLHRLGLNLVIGADDPGIFATTLAEEYEFAHQNGLDIDALTVISDRASMLGPNTGLSPEEHSGEGIPLYLI